MNTYIVVYNFSRNLREGDNLYKAMKSLGKSTQIYESQAWHIESNQNLLTVCDTLDRVLRFEEKATVRQIAD